MLFGFLDVTGQDPYLSLPLTLLLRIQISIYVNTKHIRTELSRCYLLCVPMCGKMKTHLSYDFGHTSSLIFTSTDEEHNNQELLWTSCQGRIPMYIYQVRNHID